MQSTGNGLSYTLERRKDGQSVFFQGDDASTFRAELDGLEEALGGLRCRPSGALGHVCTRQRGGPRLRYKPRLLPALALCILLPLLLLAALLKA